MKEYKRCKFCGMELDTSSLKCPHCKKTQATNLFYNFKKDNIIITTLIIIGIFACFYCNIFKMDNITSYLSSLKFNLGSFSFFEGIQDGLNNFNTLLDEEDDFYFYDITDIIQEFDDGFEIALDNYNETYLGIEGNIVKIEEDIDYKYVYLETNNSIYSFYICISKSDTDEINLLEDEYGLGSYISCEGTFYYDKTDEYDNVHYFFMGDAQID